MRKEREVLLLACKLTDDEIIEKSMEQCAQLSNLDEFEDDLAAVKSQFKSDIERAQKTVASLKTEISTRRTFRDVECRIVWDWEKKTKSWIRTDTEEEVKLQPISELEIQEELEFQRKEKEDQEKLELDEELEVDEEQANVKDN